MARLRIRLEKPARTVEVEVAARTGGGWQVHLPDGDEVLVEELLSLEQGSFLVRLAGGRQLPITLVRQGDRWLVWTPDFDLVLRLEPFGEEGRVEPEEAREDAHGRVEAPMPGKVLELRVRVGDEVERGEVLMVLEAMKMEHQITSPLRGVVTELVAEEGISVELGDLLAEITPLNEE